ncbi:hypothetical protein BGZ97_005654, partial [Linnemannia gamsii]
MTKKKDARSPAKGSYSPLSLHDPDTLPVDPSARQQRISAHDSDDDDMDHHAQGRTSIEIEPTPMTGSSSSSAIRRPTSQQRLQAPDGDIHDTDDDSHGHGGNGGGRGKNTHWGRNWIRYVALTCIIGALVLMITLLVLRPWEQKH